jgi:tetratricopeptide (TPR) repeat protein
MDFLNREDMGNFFQNHPESKLFPLIADLYSMDGKYSKAEEICKTGLNHHPDNPDGLFVLAQINRQKKNYKTVEGILKKLFKSHTVYPEALNMLAEIQEKINRSPNTVKIVRKKYERFDYTTVHQKQNKTLKRDKSGTQKTVPSVSSTELKPLKVGPQLATFTLVKILETQRLYPQALDILDMLREKGKDKKKLIEYRDRILKKFHSNK